MRKEGESAGIRPPERMVSCCSHSPVLNLGIDSYVACALVEQAHRYD